MNGVSLGYFDRFDDVIKCFLPDNGEGNSMASQIVTAVNKLIYKWFNDGDVYDNNYFLSGWFNDLSSYANWLAKNIDGAENILIKIKDAYSYDDYELILKELADYLLNYSLLASYSLKIKVGSIYDCDYIFSFNELTDDDYDDED